MKRSRYRSVALLLSAVLLLGHAQGQVASCDAPEELLGVVVGRSDRGSHVVKLTQADGAPVSVLVPEGVFRAAEAGFIAGRVDCNGEAYVTLAPDVRVRYDAAAQALIITPVLARLGSQTLDFRTLPPERAAASAAPVWGVSYGARANATYTLRAAPGTDAQAPAWNGAAYLGVGAALNQVSGSAGALVERAPDGTVRAEPRALARYVVSPDLVVYGAWNASPLASEPGFAASNFRGVALAGRGGFGRVLPELTIELAVEADIEVSVGGKLLRSFSAAPGTLRLLNLPLPTGETTVSVFITDETGSRQLDQLVPGQAALPPGAFLYSAQGGWLAGRWLAEASAQVGLPRGWRLSGQGRVTGDTYGVRVQTQYAAAPWNLAFDAAVTGGRDADGERTTRYELGATAARSFGPLGLVGTVSVPLDDAQQTTFGVTAQYNTRQWLLTADARTGLQAQSWRLGAAGTYFLDRRGSVTASVQAQPGSWRAGLSVGFSPAPRWQLDGQAGYGPDGLDGGARVRFAPDPSQSAELALSRDDLGVRYSLERAVRVQAAVSTRAASAEVTGAATVTGGVVRLQPELAQRAVLVRTGLPNVRLLLGGEAVGLTDARGDALITRLPLGETTTLRVDLAALPFGIAVQEVAREIVPPLSGVLTVDWRENFRAFRFVQFFWKPGEVAAYGEVSVGGETVLLDDEGYGLTPAAPTAQPGELRSEDGTRRCQVVIEPGLETVSCPAGQSSGHNDG